MPETEDSKRLAYNAYMREWRAKNREHARKLAAAGHAKWMAANPEKAKESARRASRKWRLNNPTTPQHAYAASKGCAKFRNIPFLLTFEEWWAIWLGSGKWEQRGGALDQYCMARHGDVGPYAVGNVRICTNRENFAEHYENRRGKPLGEQTRRKISEAARARHASGPIKDF